MGMLIGYLVLGFIAYLAYLLIKGFLSEPEVKDSSTYSIYPIYVEPPPPVREEWIVVETWEVWEER